MSWVVSMRRLMLAALAVAAVLVSLSPRAALACSAGPDYNPVAESEVIVVGQLTEWREDDHIRFPALVGSGFVPIRLTLRVERVLKGSTPATLAVVDHASLRRQPPAPNLPERTFWAGGAGACGSFDEDPTGKHAVLGLARNADGTYQAHRIHTFYLGEQHPALVWDAVVARLTHWGPVAFPLTGAGARARYDAQAPSEFLAALAADALLIVGAMLLRARSRGEGST